MQTANSGQVSGIISVVAFSFMVQEPSGIIARSSARSRSAELAHVAQHLGLGAMRVEHRMGEEARCRAQLDGNASRALLDARRPHRPAVPPKARHTASTISGVVVSSQRDAERAVADRAD